MGAEKTLTVDVIEWVGLFRLMRIGRLARQPITGWLADHRVALLLASITQKAAPIATSWYA